MKNRLLLSAGLAALLMAVAMAAVGATDDSSVPWSESERQFFEDGPGLLLTAEAKTELKALAPEERQSRIVRFLAADPEAETEVNELTEGIERRRKLAISEAGTFLDDRARMLFLHGRPLERVTVECGSTFKALEVWTVPPSVSARRLVFYQPEPAQPFRLWIPLDSKRALYTSEMEYWLDQYEELRGRIRAKRFDFITCSETRLIDSVTGIKALTDYQNDRPDTGELRQVFDPPSDLAAWALTAARTTLPDVKRLPIDDVILLFPERIRQRLVTRLMLTLAPEVELGVVTEDEATEHRIAVDGIVEEGGKIFETFRVRFKLPAEADAQGTPQGVALALERLLRPGRDYLLRLHVRDEIEGSEARLTRGIRVPSQAQRIDEPPVPEGVVVALGEELARKRLPGKDSLLLCHPRTTSFSVPGVRRRW